MVFTKQLRQTVLALVVGLVVCFIVAPVRAQAVADPLSQAGFATVQAQLEQAVATHATTATAATPAWPLVDALPLLTTLPGTPDPLVAEAARVTHAEAAVLAARQQQRLGEWGVNLRGSYHENVAQGVFDDEGLSYKRRASVAVHWDVLEGGWLDNRYAAQALTNEQQILHLDLDQRVREIAYGERFARIIQAFNAAKLPLLDQRAALLTDLVALTDALYRADYVTWDRVIELAGQQAEVEMQQANYRAYNARYSASRAISTEARSGTGAEVTPVSHETAPQPGAPPVLRLTAMDVSQHVAADHASERIALEMENLRLEGHPLRRMTLTPYVRYSQYADPAAQAGAHRAFVALGVSFTMPLPFRSPHQEEVEQTTETLLTARASEAVQAARKEAQTHVYEYAYRLKQYTTFMKQAEKLRYRVDQALLQRATDDPGYNAVRTLGLFNDLLAVRVELLDIQQQMYLKLLQLGRLLEPGALIHLIEAMPAEGLFAVPPHVTLATDEK